MKYERFSWKRIMLAVMVVVMSGVVLSACKKDNGTAVSIPAAGLMVFNLAPDQHAVGIALSGRLMSNNPLYYTNYNGIYQNIYTGARDIDVYNFELDSSVAHSTFDFQDSTYYSLFVVGNNGRYSAVTVKDDVDSAASDQQAYIRYINAIPDSSAPAVTITAGGTKVSDAAAPFAQVSSFKAVTGGDVNIALSNNSNISANRTLSLEKGKIYTALLVGDPASADSTRKVQIKYIVNGSVSPTSGK